MDLRVAGGDKTGRDLLIDVSVTASAKDTPATDMGHIESAAVKYKGDVKNKSYLQSAHDVGMVQCIPAFHLHPGRRVEQLRDAVGGTPRQESGERLHSRPPLLD